jgi:hypothetical protein
VIDRTSGPRRLIWPAVLGLVVSVALVAAVGAASGAAGQGRQKAGQVSRYGVMITSPSTRLQAARNLNAKRLRVSVRLNSLPSGPIQAAEDAGFQVLMTADAKEFPSSPPKPSVYRARLGRALDLYPTPVVSIENEETADKFYAGTPQDYLDQLKIAIPVAHNRGVKISDGGLVSLGVQLATWYDLWHRGKHSAADNYAQLAFPDSRAGAAIIDDLPNSEHPNRPILGHTPKAKETLDDTLYLIDGFRDLDLDYVNYHWYQSTPQAMQMSVDYLRRATGKAVITNELGQFDRSPATVYGLLYKTASLQIPWVIWFGSDGSGGAQGLVNADGSVRPNGVAFRNFLADCDGVVNCGRGP